MAQAKLYNALELAAELGRSEFYIYAMKKSGYAMLYGTQTTRRHALDWLAAHPDFRTTGAYKRKAKQKAVAA